jgi:hypothetical protein
MSARAGTRSAEVSGSAAARRCRCLPMLKRSEGELSPQQRRFAQEHGAIPGMHAGMYDRSVYVYRDEGWRTCRWLVDPTGKVEDFVSLRRSGTRRSVRFVRRAAVAATVGPGGDTGFA